MERGVLMVTRVGERVGMILATSKIGIGEGMKTVIGNGEGRGGGEDGIEGTSSAEDGGSGTVGDEG
jgi:hypothetical protein